MENKKIKTCFISPFAYGLFNPEASLKFGGAEVQMYLISTELARDNDFEVSFVVLDVGQEKTEEREGVKLYKAYKRGRNFLNLIIAPLKLFFTLMKINPDVVICRANGVEVGISAIYAKFFKKKFIYSIAHDDDVSGFYFKGLRGKIFKFGFLQSDVLVAQNEEQAHRLRKKNFNKKISVIKNSWKIKKEQKEKNKDIILWVGSSASFKRPEVIVDLAKDFPNEKFIAVMAKSKSNLKKYYEIIKKSEGISNLEIIEKIPFEEIGEYFGRANVFVNTSSAEGFPNTFLQAAEKKVPILSSSVDPDGFIKKYNCGLVCDDDYEKLKLNLKNILSNISLAKEMGENAFKYLEENHDIEKNIEKWKDILRE